MIKKPSISELLQLLDKPALLYWANKQGLAGIDIKEQKKVDKAIGTDIHSKIERFVKHGEQFEEQEAFIKFISGKEILGMEQDIETDFFTGRYDLKMKSDGLIYMVDYKKNHKAIYLENRLQLIAYSMAEPCDKFAIVSAPDFTVMPVDMPDREPYQEIIKALSHIYYNKRILGFY